VDRAADLTPREVRLFHFEIYELITMLRYFEFDPRMRAGGAVLYLLY
jgi:hypothetical protein